MSEGIAQEQEVFRHAPNVAPVNSRGHHLALT